MGIVYAACTSPSPYQYRCGCWCGCCLRIAPRVASPVLFSVEAGGFQRRLRKISREPPPITDTHPPPPSSKAQHQARTEHMQQRLDDAKHQSTLLQQKMIALDAHYRHQVRTSTARLSVPVRALGCVRLVRRTIESSDRSPALPLASHAGGPTLSSARTQTDHQPHLSLSTPPFARVKKTTLKTHTPKQTTQTTYIHIYNVL